MARQEHRRERQRERASNGVFDAVGRAGSGLGRGVLQGLMLGGADEVLGADDFIRAQREAPIAFTVGTALGSIPWGAMAAKPLAGLTEGGSLQRLIASSAAGSAHGGAAGAFGMTPGERSGDERTAEATIMALLGGAVGGLSVPAVRGAADLHDNLPALAGRQRMEDGSIVQTTPGQGTRRSAELNVRLAGEGDAKARAEAALRAGLRMDEYDALQASERGALNRHGAEFTPFDADMGRTSRSAIDYAAQSPGGARRLNEEADRIAREGATRVVEDAKPPAKGRGSRAPMEADAADGFMAALDRPEYHAAWLREARKLSPRQKRDLADSILAQLRDEAANAPDAGLLQQRLSDPSLKKKLDALGVRIANAPLSRAESQRVGALRGRAEPTNSFAESETGFANPEDRFLARQAPLSEEDALALLEIAMQPRRSFFADPLAPGDARLLRGEYERGARFNPASYFDGSSADLERAIRWSQPAAALLHGVPTWFGDREDPRQRRSSPQDPLIA